MITREFEGRLCNYTISKLDDGSYEINLIFHKSKRVATFYYNNLQGFCEMLAYVEEDATLPITIKNIFE